MDKKDVELLEAVARTLEGVTVSGSDNMNRLLGSINAVRTVLKNNAPVSNSDTAAARPAEVSADG